MHKADKAAYTAEAWLMRAQVLRGYLDELVQHSACSEVIGGDVLRAMDALVSDLNDIAATVVCDVTPDYQEDVVIATNALL